MTRHVLLSGLLLIAACEGVSVVTTTGPDGGGGTGSQDAGGPVSASACEVQALLDTRCSSCHGPVPAKGAPMALPTLASLRARSTSDSSLTFAEVALSRMQDTAAPMPPAPEAPATQLEVALLAAWIAEDMPSCGTSGDGGTPALSSPNLLPQEELFQCTPGVLSDAPTRLRRIQRWQWTRNVGGAVTRDWTGFSFFDNPLDPSVTSPYASYAADDTVDESMVEILLPLVGDYGRTWAGPYTGDNRLELLRTDSSLRCMWEDSLPARSCIEHYVSTLLERGVLYRAPRADEVARLSTFAQAVLAQEPSGGGEEARTHSISRIVTAASLMSGALFREEVGTSTGEGRVQLADWELAQQLSYALGDRGPGAVPTWSWPYFSAPPEGHYADIAAAARDGSIRSPGVVEQLIEQNAGGVDPERFDLVQDFGDQYRGRRGEYWLPDGVAGFFRQWLGYTRVEQVFKERPEATSVFDDGDPSGYRDQLAAWDNLMTRYYGYESTLVQQMDDFVARAVVEDVDVLKTLLTSRTFFLAATENTGFDGNATRYTGQPYGTDAVIQDTNAERWRTLPSKERAGVLTHPAWLASHGGNFEDDPSAVHRGKWVRENLLCGYVPPLSQVKVVAMVGPHAPDQNARARLEAATAKAECQGCHGLMNPLGYPFEVYNHAGYLRAHDRAPDGGTMPPDGRVVLSGMPDPALDGEVLDAVALSEKLAESPHVKRCFVRQVFRYFMGRDENRSDACTLAQMEQAYDAHDGSFRALLKALMTSPTWTTRRAAAQGE